MEQVDYTHFPELHEATKEQLNDIAISLLSENERLKEDIGTSLYELKRLERNMGIPSRGYVRNCFNSVVRTLQGALKQE